MKKLVILSVLAGVVFLLGFVSEKAEAAGEVIAIDPQAAAAMEAQLEALRVRLADLQREMQAKRELETVAADTAAAETAIEVPQAASQDLIQGLIFLKTALTEISDRYQANNLSQEQKAGIAARLAAIVGSLSRVNSSLGRLGSPTLAQKPSPAIAQRKPESATENNTVSEIEGVAGTEEAAGAETGTEDVAQEVSPEESEIGDEGTASAESSISNRAILWVGIIGVLAIIAVEWMRRTRKKETEAKYSQPENEHPQESA